MYLKVKDYTKNHLAVSAVDGEKLYNVIIEGFGEKETVDLDFEGIEIMISAFLNTAIGKLYRQYSPEQIRKLLRLKNLSRDDASLLKIVTDHAKKRFGIANKSDLDNIDLIDED